MDKPAWESSEELDSEGGGGSEAETIGSGPAAGRSPSKRGDLKLQRRIAWAGSQLQKRTHHEEKAEKTYREIDEHGLQAES